MGRIGTMAKVERHKVEGAKRDLAAAVRKFAIDWLAKHPDGANLSATTEVRVSPKRPPGFGRREPLLIVQSMVSDPDYRRLSNEQIVNRLREKYPNHIISNSFMYAPLRHQKKAVKEMLAHSGIRIDLDRYNTLSKIKGALNAGGEVNEAGEAMRAFSVRIIFTEKAVIVGDRSYSIVEQKGAPRRIRVGKAWINSANLERLFDAA